ncbi:MAG TPA: HAD-IA family hydrolase [Thermoanaerobaculia bacterium]|nr:HAD-IA family hydrolase [Thermoanaerobaculia bacterium]
MSTTRLVIFDCDGVLIDSEPIANQILRSALAELGLELSLAETMERFVGLSLAQVAAGIEEMRGAPLPAGFLAALERRTEEALRQIARPVRGVVEALAVIEAIPLPTCVASGSEPERVRSALEAAGLLARFSGRIFSSADVSRPKPAPDLFLHAAAAMNAAPWACVVVEDSVPGVRAGVAAGMRVLGFAPRALAAPLEEAGAGRVFFDMRQLPQLL